MEVLNENAAYLSNFEVLKLLRNMKSSGKLNKGSGLATVTYETIKYLEDTACQHQTPEKMKEFLAKVGDYKLTKCEKLMMVNTPPKEKVEIDCIVEDAEDRFSTEEYEDLLGLVETTVGTPRASNNVDEEPPEESEELCQEPADES
ncbi:hypothetical protein HCN44_011124 [Aphidius gifuensis]|uniref:DNA-directed RNA polymerase III subunit RPC9 n=1 Tax=Aphidius gifuensis TaxID=684658 RepID=A0A834XUT8_APHGI|nr:DNA-directed RNA polymerase III subunit RPC9-like [Aphidius gifuensis]KAF7993855.1 hypothetical protein HCN44_011124 [Aphidius gifuensis]